MAYDRCLIYQGSSPRGRSKRRQSGNGTNKMGLNTKIHLAVASFGMPVRIVVTDGIDADYLLADRGYDTDSVIKQADETYMKIVIMWKIRS